MMGKGKNQSATKPTALGTLLQASTYGMTIPSIIGMTRSPLLAIWANDLRQVGGSGKKGNKGKKGGPPTYVESIDFLLGHAPLRAVLQMWSNSTKYPMDFASQLFDPPYAWTFTVTDPNFYAVIAVTAMIPYNLVSPVEYGGSPISTSGWFEAPMWNVLEAGANPSDPNACNLWPLSYGWEPGYGATVYIEGLRAASIGSIAYNGIKVYYAKINSTLGMTPLAKLRLSFESELGSGSEYASHPTEQIIYPWYAGAGSPNIDLGSSGSLPSLKAEMLGKWSLHPSGDGDFVDMIEEIVSSGYGQCALGSGHGASPIQRGANCFDYPGVVQKKYVSVNYYGTQTIAYDMANTAGNILLAFVYTPRGDITGVTDSINGAWTLTEHIEPCLDIPAYGTGAVAVYRFVGCAAGMALVDFTFTGGGSPLPMSFVMMLEITGVDTFDTSSSATGLRPTVSVTTTNDPGSVALLYAFTARYAEYAESNLGQLPQWPVIMKTGANWAAWYAANFAQQRRVTMPGTYSMQWRVASLHSDAPLIVVAFKATNPPTYAKALPPILDVTTKELTRRQCWAGGLWGSLALDSQQAARDWIENLCVAANCAAVWSGFKLKLIPRSEVSAAGNGAVYISPTAAGPVANLTTENGDFVAEAGVSPINVVRTARTDIKTVLQMQHINRTSNYAQITTGDPDAAGIALYGVRKADPITNNAIQDVTVARAILRIMTRRYNYISNVAYKFKLNARWQLLEPMDLVTVTDPLADINLVPVRLTKVEETDTHELDCEAEPFSYGIHAPQNITVTQPVAYAPNTEISAGDVNAPVIFEPVARLSNNVNQIWFVVSSPDANYGGCQVYVSTDGGTSYNLLGSCTGNGTTGLLNGSWAAHADPDTTNDLAVDLTESLGTLADYAVADEDNFTYPCYVEDGVTAIPYELMTYGLRTLTSAYNYTLLATGGGTNHLRRAVFGAPGAAGVLHASGKRFAFLTGEGILKVNMDPDWIGKTLKFKFLSMNTFGGGVQSLSDVSPYTYVPVGTGNTGNLNWQSYVQTPGSALTNPSSTQISMAAVSVAFPANTAAYQARNFAIGAPGSPTMYYVFVADPGATGDAAGSPKTSYCEASTAKIGVAGYVFIGAIQALPAGGGVNVIPGGFPLPAGFLINGS
jgi:hypothetical protein